MIEQDVIIIGASASGLMCAIESGKRGRHVLVLDHARKPCGKILISGGGRCNFTNLDVSAENYLSHNPHFCKSALSRYTPWDIIALVEAHGISYHERSHGQLFCDDSARSIRDMLLAECQQAGVRLQMTTNIEHIEAIAHGFRIETNQGVYHCRSLAIASGGLSIPKLGATDFGYRLAQQFGLSVRPAVAGLVPFTWRHADKTRLAPLAGIAVDAVARTGQTSFRENVLFTHRGLSGPVILQLSSYWQPGEMVHIDLLPDVNLAMLLAERRQQASQQQLKTLLAQYLPKRLLAAIIAKACLEQTLASLSLKQCQEISEALHHWQVLPKSTEGFRKAEVTVGGVDTDALSSKTFECHDIKGLYFIGEVVDVTGWLGGYNFHWAWASGWCAGQYT